MKELSYTDRLDAFRIAVQNVIADRMKGTDAYVDQREAFERGVERAVMKWLDHNREDVLAAIASQDLKP